MSGNDERIPDDFPPCPKCLKNKFWTLKNHRGGSVAYLIRNIHTSASDIRYMVYFGYKGRDIRKLNEASYAECGGCETRIFGVKFIIFLKLAKRLFNELRPGFRE